MEFSRFLRRASLATCFALSVGFILNAFPTQAIFAHKNHIHKQHRFLLLKEFYTNTKAKKLRLKKTADLKLFNIFTVSSTVLVIDE